MNTKPLKTPDKIALYGGTFDPIHLGHIHTIENAAKHLDLNNVTLLPAYIPPHKDAATADIKQRVEMLELAQKHHALFTIDLRELKRNKPSYTIDTLSELKKEFPDSNLLFFIGMDSLFTFTHWYQWQEILSLCHLVVSTRPGYTSDNMPDETRALLNKHQVSTSQALDSCAFGKIYLTPEYNWNISSTDIRKKIATKQPYQELVPQNVYHYIETHQLYR